MILEGAVTIEGELSLYRGEYDNRRGVIQLRRTIIQSRDYNNRGAQLL